MTVPFVPASFGIPRSYHCLNGKCHSGGPRCLHGALFAKGWVGTDERIVGRERTGGAFSSFLNARIGNKRSRIGAGIATCPIGLDTPPSVE